MIYQNILVLILGIAASFIFTSCHHQKINKEEYELRIDKKSSIIIDKRLLISKITVNSFHDSLIINRIYDGYELCSKFFREGENFYELRLKGNRSDIFLGYDSILTFSKRDTSFTYNSTYKNAFLVFLYLLTDTKYEIRNFDKFYFTEKKCLVDTSFVETFYYDENLHIYKIINKYKNNLFVYIDKEYGKTPFLTLLNGCHHQSALLTTSALNSVENVKPNTVTP